MEIIRNPDGSLVVPIPEGRHPDSAEVEGEASENEVAEPTTRVLHPGEGGYNEALAEWDHQQNPDREPAVSTASGREEAMIVVHNVAESPRSRRRRCPEGRPRLRSERRSVAPRTGGGTHSVEAFSEEVAEAEGGEPLPAHKMTKIIGEVLAELDK